MSEAMNTFPKIDPRLRAVIMQADRPSDRGCLMQITVIMGAMKPEKRQAFWHHFEQAAGRSIRDMIPRLHAAFDVVSAELKQSPAKRRLASLKKKLGVGSGAVGETVDGEL